MGHVFYYWELLKSVGIHGEWRWYLVRCSSNSHKVTVAVTLCICWGVQLDGCILYLVEYNCTIGLFWHHMYIVASNIPHNHWLATLTIFILIKDPRLQTIQGGQEYVQWAHCSPDEDARAWKDTGTREGWPCCGGCLSSTIQTQWTRSQHEGHRPRFQSTTFVSEEYCIPRYSSSV